VPDRSLLKVDSLPPVQGLLSIEHSSSSSHLLIPTQHHTKQTYSLEVMRRIVCQVLYLPLHDCFMLQITMESAGLWACGFVSVEKTLLDALL
jgi:hypothetical protein